VIQFRWPDRGHDGARQGADHGVKQAVVETCTALLDGAKMKRGAMGGELDFGEIFGVGEQNRGLPGNGDELRGRFRRRRVIGVL
jgi:hypothetical protein